MSAPWDSDPTGGWYSGTPGNSMPTGTGGSGSTGSSTSGNGSSTSGGSDSDGYDAIILNYLAQWGLSSLAPLVNAWGKDSTNTPDMIYMKLQQTQEWKTRFAGNEARMKAGLGVLSPAEYIALEGQYRQTLAQYGIPKGFYDDKASTDGWIGGNVSPSELATRASAAADLVYNSPPEAQQAWDQWYGGGSGGAIAAILDESKALPLIQRQVQAAEIGGAALQSGLSANAGRANSFVEAGVTLQSARQAYSDIKQRMATDTSAAARFGTTFGQEQEENASLLGQGDAIRQQQTLYNEEQSQFKARGGATTASGDTGSNY